MARFLALASVAGRIAVLLGFVCIWIFGGPFRAGLLLPGTIACSGFVWLGLTAEWGFIRTLRRELIPAADPAMSAQGLDNPSEGATEAVGAAGRDKKSILTEDLETSFKSRFPNAHKVLVWALLPLEYVIVSSLAIDGNSAGGRRRSSVPSGVLDTQWGDRQTHRGFFTTSRRRGFPPSMTRKGVGHGILNVVHGQGPLQTLLNPPFVRAAISDRANGSHHPLFVPHHQALAYPSPAHGGPHTSPENAPSLASTLLEKLDSGRRRPPPSIPKVFRLYCIEALSAAQVARKCRCFKSAVIRRLSLIPKKTGLSPVLLRKFAPEPLTQTPRNNLLYADAASEGFLGIVTKANRSQTLNRLCLSFLPPLVRS